MVEAVDGAGWAVFQALSLLRGNYRLQVLTLAPFLAAVAIGSLRNLLRLVDGGLFDVGPIHVGERLVERLG